MTPSLIKTVNSKGCPKQPGNHECGYYVMKFMHDVVRNGMNFVDSKLNYSVNEIDGLNVDLGMYVLSKFANYDDED